MENVVVIDRGTHIVSSVRVKRINISTAVCTVEQFEDAKGDLQKLVPSVGWKQDNRFLDTSIFADDLEAAMSDTELKERGSCEWDRKKLIGKDDFLNRTIQRAIQCIDTNNEKYYVIGVFKWE